MSRPYPLIETFIGTRIEAGRLRRGLSLAEVARSAALSPEQVEQVEAGRRRPGASELYRLCAALALEPRALFVDVRSVGKDDGDALGPQDLGDPVGKAES